MADLIEKPDTKPYWQIHKNAFEHSMNESWRKRKKDEERKKDIAFFKSKILTK